MANRIHFASADELETVYYETFRHGDMDVMRALWAQQDQVTCIHPGSGVITGYEAVIRSWSYILQSSTPPQLVYTVLKREVTDEMAVHLVSETIPLEQDAQVVVLATNVYRHFPEGWLMIGHHASLVQTASQGQTLQ